METTRQQAQQFLKEEKAFRLGSLMTEAAHPKTLQLSQTLAQDIPAGIC